jgi:hypothetical protein
MNMSRGRIFKKFSLGRMAEDYYRSHRRGFDFMGFVGSVAMALASTACITSDVKDYRDFTESYPGVVRESRVQEGKKVVRYLPAYVVSAPAACVFGFNFFMRRER